MDIISNDRRSMSSDFPRVTKYRGVEEQRPHAQSQQQVYLGVSETTSLARMHPQDPVLEEEEEAHFDAVMHFSLLKIKCVGCSVKCCSTDRDVHVMTNVIKTEQILNMFLSTTVLNVLCTSKT